MSKHAVKESAMTREQKLAILDELENGPFVIIYPRREKDGDGVSIISNLKRKEEMPGFLCEVLLHTLQPEAQKVLRGEPTADEHAAVPA